MSILLQADALAADPVKGFQTKVKVSAPTRIDWTFAVSNRSVTKPPANWFGDYDSTKTTYDLFVPPTYTAKQSWPLVLFISPGGGPGGWKEWEATCKKNGILFASPYGAGNNTKANGASAWSSMSSTTCAEPTTSTRTAPTSAAIPAGPAWPGIIGFALPEYFGGIIPVCAGVEMRG